MQTSSASFAEQPSPEEEPGEGVPGRSDLLDPALVDDASELTQGSDEADPLVEDQGARLLGHARDNDLEPPSWAFFFELAGVVGEELSRPLGVPSIPLGGWSGASSQSALRAMEQDLRSVERALQCDQPHLEAGPWQFAFRQQILDVLSCVHTSGAQFLLLITALLASLPAVAHLALHCLSLQGFSLPVTVCDLGPGQGAVAAEAGGVGWEAALGVSAKLAAGVWAAEGVLLLCGLVRASFRRYIRYRRRLRFPDVGGPVVDAADVSLQLPPNFSGAELYEFLMYGNKKLKLL